MPRGRRPAAPKAPFRFVHLSLTDPPNKHVTAPLTHRRYSKLHPWIAVPARPPIQPSVSSRSLAQLVRDWLQHVSDSHDRHIRPLTDTLLYHPGSQNTTSPYYILWPCTRTTTATYPISLLVPSPCTRTAGCVLTRHMLAIVTLTV